MASDQNMQNQQSGTFQPANAQMFGQLYNSGINPYVNNYEIQTNNVSGGYNWKF